MKSQRSKSGSTKSETLDEEQNIEAGLPKARSKRVSNSLVNDWLTTARTKSWWRLETGLVAAAVLAGLLSGVLGHANSNATKRQLAQRYATAVVIVAKKDLAFGEKIDASMVVQGDMLVGNQTKNTVTVESLPLIMGKRIAMELKAGDPILISAVQGATEASRMAEAIPAGKRLFSLTINDIAASHGFVRPNDHVDILAHVTLPTRGLTTFTVLQDVTLVSVGPSSVLSESGKSTGASDVSFFVETKDIEMLAFAHKRGQFSLSLRNPKDIGTRDAGKGIDINEFLDYEGINHVSGGGDLNVTERGKSISKQKSE